jgi:MFS family permease
VPLTRFESLRAFRYPAFVQIWIGAFISNLGGWIQSIAIGVYVTEATGKAGWTGTMAALTYAPAVVLGPLGGALADRLDRARFVALLTGVQMLSAAGLAALAIAGTLPLGAIASLVLVSGCANALAVPAFNALLSEIVAPEDLLSAVSLASGQFNLARTVGPMLTALVLTWGGITVAFVVNAVSYVAVLLALRSAPRAPRTRIEVGEGLAKGIARGIAVARQDPGIRLALGSVAAAAVLVAPFIGLMPAYAIKVFGKGAAAASLLAVGQGIGALVAAFTANALARRLGVQALLRRAFLAIGPIAVAYWLAPTYELAFAVLMVQGGVYLWMLTALSTTCIGRVSREVQARMSSLYSMTLSGGYSLGLLIQGWLGDRVGLRAVPVAAAALLFLLALSLHRRGAFAAVDAPSKFGGVLQREAPASPEGESRNSL